MSADESELVPNESQVTLLPGASARILVVDDQPANIQIVGGMLGKLGCEIVPASDGPSALKRLALRLPDLILLDVLMPGMDGIEVCRRIRAEPAWADIPIIFLSAADDKDLIIQALKAGGVDYVTKPFNHAEMVLRVRTHLALKAARDQLKQLAEDKDELIGILTHDMKNHLGGMQMSARLLRDRMARQGDSKLEQLCENICHSTGQLLSFVKEFLANSAADHGVIFNRQPVNLGAIVARAVENYHEAALRKSLQLKMHLSQEPVMAQADPLALGQVIDNLISNAVKFSPPGKTISVTVRSEANGAQCLVQDQGPGFSAEDRKRMFRRYGRLSARPTGGEPSTGLGLSIVKKLVQNMEGDLTCESTPGEGATFLVRLPHSNNPK